MALQYSFGFDPPRPPILPAAMSRPALDGHNKLLILAKPDEAAAACVADRADRLAADLGFKGRLVRPDLLHVTLHPVGLYSTVPQSIVDAVGACADTVRMRPFTVSLNMAKNFRRRSGTALIVLCGDDGVLGLRTLHDTLADALAKRFGATRFVSFEPHMTLSYRAMSIADTPIEPINFVIREFVLVNSRIGHGRHVVLRRWQLDG
jgi:RNA 2',3'-cyclic 3'-phosphodiesterase